MFFLSQILRYLGASRAFLFFAAVYFSATAHAALVDLVILKAGPVSAKAGDTIPYTLTIRNSGPDEAGGAVFQDVLPSGLSFVSASCDSAMNGAVCPVISHAGNTVSGTIATFPANGELVITLNAKIPLQSASSYSNTATVTAPAGATETNPASNSTTISTSITLLTADLTAVIAPTGTAAWTLDSPVTYTFTYTNTGPDAVPAANISTEFSPVNNPLVIASAINTVCVSTGGAVCPASSPTTFPHGNVSLPVGSSLTFTSIFTPITYTSTCVNKAGGTTLITLKGMISPATGITDPNMSNNSASASATAPISNPICPPVVITGSKTGPASFTFGSEQSYTMVLENTGTISANGSKISDLLSSLNNLYPIGLVTMNGIRIVCVAEGGAVCPTFSIPSSITFGSSGSGGSIFNGLTVATWPAGGKLTLTLYFTMRLANPLPCGAPLNVNINNVLSVQPVGQSSTKTLGSWNINTPSGNQLCPQTDLSLVRSPASMPMSLGTPLPDYTLTVTNHGPNAANGATLNEAILFVGSPNPVMKSVSIDCAASGGAQCPSTLTPSLNTHNYFTGIILPVLPAGGSLTFTFRNAIIGLASGSSCYATARNSGMTGQIYAPSSVTDTNFGNDRALFTTTEKIRCAAISVNKQVSDASPLYGAPITYTIDVSNASPGTDANSAMLSDSLPAGFAITGAATCGNTAGGAVCGPVVYDPESHTINSSIATLPAGGSLRITIPGRVDKPGSWSNTASIPVNIGDLGSPLPDSARSTVNFQTTGVDLAISKTGPATYTPGAPISYTLLVSSFGNPVSGADIVDNVPADIENVTWTCASLNLALCSQTSGSGNTIALQGNFPQGGSVSGMLIITVNGVVKNTATGSINNTATVAAPSGETDINPGNNSASVTSVPIPPTSVDLSLDKHVTPQHYTDGTVLTYTITASNAGPASVIGASVTDTLPAGMTAAGWTCATTRGTASCPASGSGAPTGVPVDLATDSSVTLTVMATVNSGTTGNLVNNADITPPSGIIDPDMSNNTASVTVQPQGIPPIGSDVRIVKTVAPTSYIPGTVAHVSYSIVVSNAGPDNAIGVAVTDTLPAGLSIDHWTCNGSGGSQCPANGNGSLNGVLVDLVNDGQVIFNVQATIAASATGDLTNEVKADQPATSPPDLNPSNNIATSTISAGALPQATLAINKTSSTSDYTPGTATTVTYLILAANGGPAEVTGAIVKDLAPPGLILNSWTCSVSAPGDAGSVTSSCPANGSGAQLESGIAVNLAVHSLVEFIVQATVAADARGTLNNAAEIIAPPGINDPTGGNNLSVYPITQNAIPVDLAVSGNVLPMQYTQGNATDVVYTVVFSNLSGIDALDASLTDTIPTQLTLGHWTCNASNGATCPASNGTGSLNGLTADLPANSALTFTIDANISTSAIGDIDYRAEIGVASGFDDTDPGNNSATFTVEAITLALSPDFSLNKTANVTTVAYHEQVVYTLTSQNTGDTATSLPATIVDDIDPAFRIDNLGTGCLQNPPGSQHVECTVPTGTAVNGSNAFTITVTLIDNTLPNASTLPNTASISGGGGNACVQSASCISGVNLTVRGALPPGPAGTPIPLLSHKASLTLLAALLLACALVSVNRQRRRSAQR